MKRYKTYFTDVIQAHDLAVLSQAVGHAISYQYNINPEWGQKTQRQKTQRTKDPIDKRPN